MKTITTCGVLLRNQSGKLLLLRRSETDVRRPSEWDLPGGHTENAECVEETVARELREESGLVMSSPPQLIFAHTAVFDDDNSNVTWLFYVGQTKGEAVVLSDEHSEFQWVTPEVALQLVSYKPKRMAIEHALINGHI